MLKKYLPLIIVLLLSCGTGYGLKLYFQLNIVQTIIATAGIGALGIFLWDMLDGYLAEREFNGNSAVHPLEVSLYDSEVTDDEFYKELMEYMEEKVMVLFTKSDEEEIAWLRTKVQEIRPGVWKKFSKEIPEEHKGCCDPREKDAGTH